MAKIGSARRSRGRFGVIVIMVVCAGLPFRMLVAFMGVVAGADVGLPRATAVGA